MPVAAAVCQQEQAQRISDNLCCLAAPHVFGLQVKGTLLHHPSGELRMVDAGQQHHRLVDGCVPALHCTRMADPGRQRLQNRGLPNHTDVTKYLSPVMATRAAACSAAKAIREKRAWPSNLPPRCMTGLRSINLFSTMACVCLLCWHLPSTSMPSHLLHSVRLA